MTHRPRPEDGTRCQGTRQEGSAEGTGPLPRSRGARRRAGREGPGPWHRHRGDRVYRSPAVVRVEGAA